jgi:predicted ribosomally synthesized peptide with SipW-like signal peptide
MKKILLSLITIGAVSAAAIGASRAFFSDVETSTANIFTAGAIDLTIDYSAYFNKAVDGDPSLSWAARDLTPDDRFFDFNDLKPGDFGEGTISIHVYNNDAWACLTINSMQGLENDRLEPEITDGDNTDGVGELADQLYFTAWDDVNGNNIWEAGEQLLFSNQVGPASDVLDGKTYALADSTTGNPLTGGVIKYIGLQWCFGEMTIDTATHTIACDASNTNNVSQTDSLTADVTFTVEQSQNNPAFRCDEQQIAGKQMLVLENKTQQYNRITNDGRYAVLTFNTSGTPFEFDLKAYKLEPTTSYSLIYYADGWPGNNPGYYFGSWTTDGSGNIAITGSSTIGFNLPAPGDANTTGAKIWLIPSDSYNSGSRSVTVWPFADDWLFESNLINYTE